MNIKTIRSIKNTCRRATLSLLAAVAAFLLVVTFTAPAYAVTPSTAFKKSPAQAVPKVSSYSTNYYGPPVYVYPEASLIVGGVTVTCTKETAVCKAVIDVVARVASESKDNFYAVTSQNDVAATLYEVSIACKRKNEACDAGTALLFGYQQ